uniref:DNA-(Apurinic or apyrimidinic site) lyase 2-like n=2 Tax=Nicotiana TaxID=4085 RepID=A0A1S3XGK6_TOBAC|nr:PREDICTED: DNA-(apurinic or apyrimidinic site) lyase 2-like [Nicotiana sylvestris]XP_016438964.1 PREDICTED: DNA-(apurinic or apyrimidinic site) lyase 2-like [Nicotiana tabacum]
MRFNMLCGCGQSASLRTSTTNANPGRRFFGCKYYGDKDRVACGFFQWYDPEFPDQSKEIILGLQKDKMELEVELKKKKKKKK